MRNPDQFCLTAVYSAPERPSAVGICAIVDVAASAEKAFPAKGLHVDGDAVSDIDGFHGRTDFFYDSHHLVSEGYSFDSSRDASVFNMNIARADTRHSHSYDCVGVAKN